MSLIILPNEVEGFFREARIPARFSPGEAEDLVRQRPRVEAGFVSFPTPRQNGPLSVHELRRILGVSPEGGPCIFFDHPWYLEEPFGGVACEPGWHTLAGAPLEASLDSPVNYADRLAGEGLYLPTAVEVVLMLFLALHVSGERFLLRKHTWTLDRTSTRRFVSVGAFGKKGLFISSHEVGYKSQGLGICPSRHLRLER